MATPTLIEEKYLDEYQQIVEKLSIVQELLDKNVDETNNIHYGHIGDLKNVQNKLDEIIKFLK